MKKEDNSSSMLQLFFFYFTFAPAKEPKDLNLIIDIGNTKAKIAFFDGGEIVDIVAESNQSLGCLKAFCSKYPVEQGIVATAVSFALAQSSDSASGCQPVRNSRNIGI